MATDHTTKIVAPLALTLAGVALLFAINRPTVKSFACRVCRIVLPDYENYGFNNGGGWQDGFCKRCMLAVSDGRVNLIP